MAAQLRLGLLGAGRWGRNYIRTIAASAGVRLARLASRNPDSANLVPPDCVIFADWREMLDARALDGVIVATPPGVHAEMALAQCRLAAVQVCFRALSDAEIERYLCLEQPYDCAGSAKSEGLGITLLDSIGSDDPTALVGLPLIRTCQLLRLVGIVLP